jgi:hypothetical protein
VEFIRGSGIERVTGCANSNQRLSGIEMFLNQPHHFRRRCAASNADKQQVGIPDCGVIGERVVALFGRCIGEGEIHTLAGQSLPGEVRQRSPGFVLVLADDKDHAGGPARLVRLSGGGFRSLG